MSLNDALLPPSEIAGRLAEVDTPGTAVLSSPPDAYGNRIKCSCPSNTAHGVLGSQRSRLTEVSPSSLCAMC